VYSDPSWLTKGVLPPSVMEDHFDVNGYLEPLFSKIKADQTAYGNVTSDGGTEEGTKKFILRDDIKSIAVMGAADPVAFAALKRQLQNMSPEMQGKIAKIAQDNGITPEAAAALELGIGLVEFTERTRNVTAPSDASAGRKDIEEGLNWLAEWRKGAEEGKYEGNDMSSLFGISPSSGEKLPDAYKTLKGWVFDQTEVYDQEADKNIKKETVIDAISLDRGKGNWVIKLNTGEIREIPTEKFESEVIPRLGAYNKEKLTGIGGYLNSAKKSGYFQDIKGTGAEEMVKTNPKSGSAAGPYVPGKKQSGPYIPGK